MSFFVSPPVEFIRPSLVAVGGCIHKGLLTRIRVHDASIESRVRRVSAFAARQWLLATTRW